MKKPTKFNKTAAVLFSLLLIQFLSLKTAFAQLIDVDINEGEWYENPYVFIIGILVLVVIILAFRKK